MNQWISLGLSALLAFSLVLSLYIWKQDFPRDDPITIKRRFVSAGSVSILALIVAWLLYAPPPGFESLTYLEMIGVRFSNLIAACTLPLLLTAILFSGSLCLLYYHPSLRDPVIDFQDWIWWRNFIVGPLCEEVVFRSCIFAFLLQGGWDYQSTVILSCSLFGLAHVHHLKQHGSWVAVSFQLFYTTVFGVYAGFLFLRTGHLISPFLAHWFCNYMGFPRLDLVFELKLKDAMIVSSFFVIGVFLFGRFLFPLTDPTLYDNPFYSAFSIGELFSHSLI